MVPLRPTNRDQKAQTNQDQWPTWPGRPPGLTNRVQCHHWSRFWIEPGLKGQGISTDPLVPVQEPGQKALTNRDNRSVFY